MEPIRTLVGLLGFKVDKGPLEDFDDEFDRSKGLFDDVQARASGLMDRLAKLNQVWEFTAKAVGTVYSTMKELTLSVVEHGAAVADTSAQLGIEAKELQRLQYAGEMAGASADTVNKAILEQSKIMRETKANATTPFGVALKEIGVKFEEIEHMSPADRFGRIGEALQFVDDAGRRSALSLALFGGEGAKILPLALEGRSGLAALGDEAERLGFVLGDDVVAGAANLDDSLQKTGILINGIKNDIGAALMPTIAELVGELSNWVKENRELIKDNVVGFIDGLIAAGKTLGPIVMMAAKAIGSLVEMLGGAEKVVGPVTAGLGAMRLSCLAALGPWGLLAAAGVAAGVAIAGALADAEKRTLSLTKAAIRMKESLEFETRLEGKSMAELQQMKDALAKERAASQVIGGDVRGKTPAQIKKLNEERKLDLEAINKREAALDAVIKTKNKEENKANVGRLMESKKIRDDYYEAQDKESQKISDIEELRGLRRKRKKSTVDLTRIAELQKALGPEGAAPKGGGAKKTEEKKKTLDELIGASGPGLSGIIGGGAAPGPGLQTINQRIDYHQENTFKYEVPAYAARDAEATGRYMGRAAANELDEQNQRAANAFAGRAGKAT